MKNDAKIGIFLCQCGGKISDRLDLLSVGNLLKDEEGIAHTGIYSYPCLTPGISALQEDIAAKGLNRVVLGGCSSRVMKKKIVDGLSSKGITESQVDLVNLRGHVAMIHNEGPEDLARKAAALVAGAAAGLRHLDPQEAIHVEFKGPALIVGGGISGFIAAKELARMDLESFLFTDADSPTDVLAALHKSYPGNRINYENISAMIEEVFHNPLIDISPNRPVEYITGHVGDYRIGFQDDNGRAKEVVGSAVILAFDREFGCGKGEFVNGEPRIIDQVELEERMANHEIESGRLVFWINDREVNGAAPEISITAAWQNSFYLAQHYTDVKPAILYPDDLTLPVTGADLISARQMGLSLFSYHPEVNPTVQAGYITFLNPLDHLEHEIPWNTLVLSSVPMFNGKFDDLLRWLPVFKRNGGHLTKSPIKLKPGQVAEEGMFLTGSAKQICDLNDAVRQGKNAAKSIFKMKEKAETGELKSPSVVVTVDEDLCEGCGLCSEICPCGGVERLRQESGGVPRKVDPLVCTGGGTCAASCPYDAMKVLNNTTRQLDARVKTILSRMNNDEALAFLCGWGGLAAADLAGIKGFEYTSRIFPVAVNCLGSIDPLILSMAFLNGAAGILLIGCPPGVCHYAHGVDHSWIRVNFIKKLLHLAGIERERIALGYVDVNKPEDYIRMVESFMEILEKLGPMPRDEQTRKRLYALHAATHNPRVRWILGVGLRRPAEKDYPADQYNAMEFDEMVLEILKEEFLAAKVITAVTESAMKPFDIARQIGESVDIVSPVLTAMVKEGRIIIKDWENRYPIYTRVV
jgi:heterodisulfide reductase subunit A-like polyferredoxin/coenzyme F420-reducing hydrogenase delta subunit